MVPNFPRLGREKKRDSEKEELLDGEAREPFLLAMNGGNCLLKPTQLPKLKVS